MMKRGRIFATIFMTFLLIVMPVAANAQTASLTCNTNNGSVDSGQLYDTGTPTAPSGACQYQGTGGIVTQIACNYMLIMNDVMSMVYCSMQYALVNILQVVLTLYVAVFGIQILLGHAQLNAKEILTRLLKISMTWLFATQAQYGIGFAFRLFVGTMSDGATWVIRPALSGVTGTMPFYAYLDTFVSGMILGPFVTTNFPLIGFFVIMVHIIPSVAMMAVYWFWETLCTIGRILIAFLLSITAISFLIVLSPIFLSFMLWQATNNFYENWLRYLFCYTLQIVVVFAIAVMWILSTSIFIGFFSDLAAMLLPYKQLLNMGDLDKPITALGFCPGTLQQLNTGPQFVTSVCNAADLIPPSRWVDQADFMYYIFYHLISALLIAIAFKTMIRDAPALVQSIISPGLVPPLLGGGWGKPWLIGGSGGGQARQARQEALLKKAGSAVEDMLKRWQQGLKRKNPGK